MVPVQPSRQGPGLGILLAEIRHASDDVVEKTRVTGYFEGELQQRLLPQRLD